MNERFIGILAIILLLTACSAPTPTPTQLALSPWGVPQTIGEAWRREPPALLVQGETIYYAWSNGSRHYFRVGDQPPLQLPIRGSIPYAHSLLPLGDDLLLLWLDEDAQRQRIELWGAVISQSGGVQSLPLPISAEGAQRYSAAATNNTIQVVWSHRRGADTILSATTINANGVPFAPVELRSGGDYPQLVRDILGNVTLYWMERRETYAGLLRDEEGYALLDDPQRLTQLPDLGAGTTLDSFYAAHDGVFAHLFWNTRTAGGRRTVLTSVGQIAATNFTVPAAFSIQLAQGIFVEPISFARPLAGQHLALPVVLTTPQELGVATFRAGGLEDYEALLATPLLLAPPMLNQDIGGSLVLAWTEAMPDQPATLVSLRSP